MLRDALQGTEGIEAGDVELNRPPPSFTVDTLEIYSAQGHELWTHHPSRDVAAITIKAPPEFAKAALPVSYLATDDSFDKYQVNAGDEMMALGFPRGLSANPAGFPILRSGRVASYPLAPAKIFPTFLLDFSVFPGNSGGPVFVNRSPKAAETGVTPAATTEAKDDSGFIAGLLTQQVELNSERLEIGIVTHAKFVRETIALMQNPLASTTLADGAGVAGARTTAGVAGGTRTAAAEEAARD